MTNLRLLIVLALCALIPRPSIAGDLSPSESIAAGMADTAFIKAGYDLHLYKRVTVSPMHAEKDHYWIVSYMPVTKGIVSSASRIDVYVNDQNGKTDVQQAYNMMPLPLDF